MFQLLQINVKNKLCTYGEKEDVQWYNMKKIDKKIDKWICH